MLKYSTAANGGQRLIVTTFKIILF